MDVFLRVANVNQKMTQIRLLWMNEQELIYRCEIKEYMGEQLSFVTIFLLWDMTGTKKE